MSASRRMRAWGAGIAAMHAVLAVVVSGSEAFFALCALVTLVLSQVVAPLLRRRPDDPGGGPPGPPGGDDDPPPPWWPGFERELRAYLEDRERAPSA